MFKGTRREGLKSALYLRLKKRKTFFLEKNEIFEIFSFKKCRIVPKNVKGGPFLIYKHSFCCKITKKLEGGLFGDTKKFSKKVSQCRKKIERGDFFSLGRFRRLRSKRKKNEIATLWRQKKIRRKVAVSKQKSKWGTL